MPSSIPPELAAELRQGLARFRESRVHREIVDPKAEVLTTYQPVFAAENIPDLTAETFRRFLLFESNKHWTGLQRQGTRIAPTWAACSEPSA